MTKRFDKRQTSRHPKYVATDDQGDIIYSGQTKRKFETDKKKYLASLETKSSAKIENIKPQFDPNTGERIN